MLQRIGGFWSGVIGTVLILLILGFTFQYWGPSVGMFSKSTDMMSGQAKVVDAEMYKQYNNKNVLGSEVINAALMNQNKPQFAIHIKTGSNPTGFFAENDSISPQAVIYATPATPGTPVAAPTTTTVSSMVTPAQMQDPSSLTTYVNENATFTANIYADTSGAVRLIEFVQK